MGRPEKYKKSETRKKKASLPLKNGRRRTDGFKKDLEQNLWSGSDEYPIYSTSEKMKLSKLVGIPIPSGECSRY
ncbi:unnamed protein product [Caenorhabditis brenneri]